MSVTVSVNGRDVQVPEASSVLDAVNASGDYISQLCKDADMKQIGACRTCLVEVEGANGYPASCSVPVTDGMKVWTDTPEVAEVRRGVLELTMAMVSSNGNGTGDYGDLTVASAKYGIDQSRWASRGREPVDDSNPVFDIAMSDCILCGRCVQACQDGHQFIGAIDLLGAGSGSRIGTFMDKPLASSVCTTCGQCLSVCPTGAIDVKKPPKSVARSVETTCPYCGVGCGVVAQVDERERMIGMLDNPENQSSLGMLCVKGRFGYSFVQHEDRITTPLVRRNGKLSPASWDEALDYVAERLSRYRPEEFGTLCSAKATNEDGYVQQKWSRLVMGSNNIDHCTRLCHAPSVQAMLESLGSGATSNSYVDYEEAGCLVIVGSDANSNHPVAAARMRRAVIERGAKLIVINPRRIEMCDFAELWLRPKPGADVALLNAMAKVILDEGLADEQFIRDRTEGFDEWRRVVDRYTLELAEELTGVRGDDHRARREDIRQARLRRLVPHLGHGRDPAHQRHRQCPRSSEPCPRGRPAGQAGQRRLAAEGSEQRPRLRRLRLPALGLPGVPGHRGQRGQVPGSLGQPPLPSKRGMVVTDMVEAAIEGRLKAMYVTGENPLLSEPDLHHAEQAFSKLDFLVVQDIFMHETAQLADVVLPAASFAEKDGTFTNSERRVQRVRKVIDPVGDSRPDWAIICDLARRMSKRRGLGVETQFEFGHPSEIWDEMAALTPIVSGISYERLDAEGGIQWPCPTPDHPGTRFLYETGFPRGPRAKFVPFDQGPQAEELPDRRFPLILNTGRNLYHWHGGTITRRASALLAKSPELQIAISAEDGERYGVADGEWAGLSSRRGRLEGRITYTEKMRSGEVFVPFVRLRDHAANFLTNSAFDPNSKIPEYKVCAVRIEKLSNGSGPTAQ